MKKALSIIGLLLIQAGMFMWTLERLDRFTLSEFFLVLGGLIFAHLAIVGIAELILEEPPQRSDQ